MRVCALTYARVFFLRDTLFDEKDMRGCARATFKRNYAREVRTIYYKHVLKLRDNRFRAAVF